MRAKTRSVGTGIGLLLVGACLISGAAGCTRSTPPAINAGDLQILGEIKDAYIEGMNRAADPSSRKFSEFVDRYMAPDFQGTVLTGQKVKSAREFKDCMGKLATFIGLDRSSEPKGVYQVKGVDVQSRYVARDMIVSVGTTKEFVQGVFASPAAQQPLQGPPLNYKTAWTLVLRKVQGEWKIVWGDIKVAGGDIDETRMEEIRKAADALFTKK